VTHIDNHSPFPVELFSFPDQQGQEALVLVIAATFDGSSGELEPAAKQSPVQAADEHFGEPALTSVRREADVAVEKPFVDIIINGSAYAPNGRPVPQVVVELHVSDIHKHLVVSGDRCRGPLGIVSPAEPFVTMPIIYERAFGGSSGDEVEGKKYVHFRYNPVGLGFRNLRSRLPEITTEVPNVEYATGARADVPAGFGVISRGWSPRLEYAGTYDQQWLEHQWPLLPHDFDVRHYQAAPADQQSGQICGGEPVRLVGLTPEGTWDFSLPELIVPASLIFDGYVEEARPKLDTIVINAAARTVHMSLRLRISLARVGKQLREICLGELSGGYISAKAKRKKYIDFRGHVSTGPRLAGRQ
jgi:hypothetical protein